MDSSFLLGMAADALLLTHVVYVAFVVLGVVAIYAGYSFGWDWVRGFRWRVCHMAAIAYVVVQSWLGKICPLTIWEIQLRSLAGETGYEGSFIQYWLHELLYYEAPSWVFVVLYTGFGALVMATWLIVPPQRSKK